MDQDAMKRDVEKLGVNLAYAKFALNLIITQTGQRLRLDLVTIPMLLRDIAGEMEDFKTVLDAERIANEFSGRHCRRRRERRKLGS